MSINSLAVNIRDVLNKLDPILKNIIWFSYLSLAVITPLIFSTKNSELFEVPKMIFVYLIATIILTATLLKFVHENKVTFPIGATIGAFLAFVAVQVASTLTSIDKFTSIFGYPTRLNGGLLSTFAYLIIFAGILINLTSTEARKLIIAAVISSLFVALWGIPAHFGYDPSCYVLTGNLNSSCWQKDFDPTLRIFSTMGQPNWLASYLILILPFSLALFLTYKEQKPRIFFGALSAILFLAFIFTNSRAGAIGAFVALVIFSLSLGGSFFKKRIKIIIPIGAVLLVSTILFGGSLFGRILELKQKPNTPNAPTESSAIRIIVWKGAVNVFKRWPLFGSGPETFAYSYYQFRPEEHNKTTEWNFFYNKAHNEFLNYLANSGIFGLASYIVLISSFLWTIYKLIGKENALLVKAGLSALIGYFVSIFFGFSTVATQLLMFLLVPSLIVLTKTQTLKTISLKLPNDITKKLTLVCTILIGVWAISIPIRIYFADIFYERANTTGIKSTELISYNNAIATFPGDNPFYLSDYSLALSKYTNDDSENSTELAQTAKLAAQKSRKLAPNNFIITRRVANTYLVLAQTDKTYANESLTLGEDLVKLSPTDPQSYLTLAKIQFGLDKKKEAIDSLNKGLELKNDYIEAQQLLDEIRNSDKLPETPVSN